MVHIANKKISFNMKCCESINIKKDGKYLLIDLVTDEIFFNDDSFCCFFCKKIEDEFLNFKGFLICEECREKIANGEINTTYY